MKYSYNWLKELVPKIPKPDKLAEILTMHSFEVADVVKMKGDFIFDIDVLSNRGPDCFSHIGIAREISTITNQKLKTKKEKLIEDRKLKAKDFVSVDVRHLRACPRYTARVITGVKVGPSLKWVQEKLIACGLRPINNIVDATNYMMLETGQPLHAFDLDKIESGSPKSETRNPKQIPWTQRGLPGGLHPKSQIKKIIIRKAQKGEKVVTLDDEKYDLNEDILIIADTREPLAIAGIKGGRKAEIDKETNKIVIESANFSQKVIRRGSQKLNLKTDASLRFEHGITPNLTEIGVNGAAYLIQKIAGGKVVRGLVDFYPKKVFPKRIKLDIIYVEKLLGAKISKAQAKNILQRLGFKVSNTSMLQSIEVEVPTWRLDVLIPEDLIEEIGRVSGFDKLPAVFPKASLIPPKRNLALLWENLTKDSLKEAGFSEVYNYSFVGDKLAEILNYQKVGAIELENPISDEQKYLRPSLIPNLLKNTIDNFRFFEKMRIFELGKIYNKKRGTKNKEQIVEKTMLTGLISGKNDAKDEGFYRLKGVIDSLLNKMGISNIWYDEYQPKSAAPSKGGEPRPFKNGREDSKISIWQPGGIAEIKVGQTKIGFLGMISPKITNILKIKADVVLFDIDFELLSRLSSEEQGFRPISRYPSAVRDLAVLVPRGVKVVEVLNKINAAGGLLVRDVDLFDIYEGEELPDGKKNLAFSIIYQAEDHTLSSKEIDQLHNKIIKALEEELGWQVRK